MNCKDTKRAFRQSIKTGETVNAKALAHINTCAACAKEYAVLKKIAKALILDAGETPVKIPSNYNQAIWNKIDGQTPVSFWEKVLSAFKKPAFAGMAAALACFVLVIFVVKYETRTQTKPADIAVSVERKIQNIHARAQKNNSTVSAKKNIIKTNDIVQAKAESTVMLPCAEKKVEQQAQGFGASVGTQAGGNAAVIAPAVVAAASLKEENKITPSITAQVFTDGARLENNKINPYKNDKVVIKYSLSKSSDACVEVYNRNGEHVKKIFSGTKAAGSYEEKWGGEDKTGKLVSAGIYIIYVKTGNVESKLKACVVK